MTELGKRLLECVRDSNVEMVLAALSVVAVSIANAIAAENIVALDDRIRIERFEQLASDLDLLADKNEGLL